MVDIGPESGCDEEEDWIRMAEEIFDRLSFPPYDLHESYRLMRFLLHGGGKYLELAEEDSAYFWDRVRLHGAYLSQHGITPDVVKRKSMTIEEAIEFFHN